MRFAGLITTPGIAYLTRTRDFVAGVMISSSHNPYEDNGLKVFDHTGLKLPDNQEHWLEEDLLEILARNPTVQPASVMFKRRSPQQKPTLATEAASWSVSRAPNCSPG